MLSVIHQPHQLLSLLNERKRQGASIGFVPTMGALHEGHASLIEKSWNENDVTVCSIFVNPTQFNNPDDFLHYPKTIEQDTQLLQEAGCDYLFLPSTETMYPTGTPRTHFHFGALETVMEGAFRAGHFNGVGLIVSKLLHLVQPDKAYFGLKDLQQYLVVKQLVADLGFPVQIIGCPIIRDQDGLAMSSRNKRLTAPQRTLAPLLYQALQKAESLLAATDFTQIQKEVADLLATEPSFKLEYFEIADGQTLEPLQQYSPEKSIALCIAAFLGDVRLIDNILIEK